MKIENITVLKADEGKVITNWDGKDIKNYSGSSNFYCPEGVDISEYYEISEEQHLKNADDRIVEIFLDSSINGGVDSSIKE